MKASRVDLYKQAIAKYGTERQTNKAIEELAELTAAIQKHREGRVPLSAVVEEMADVLIMVEQLTLIYDLSPNAVDFVKRVKLGRLKGKLDGDDDET